jgi:hypothetical protein
VQFRPAILVVLLVAFACDRTPIGKPEPVVCPLTGQEKPSDFPVDRPVVAIKIDNIAAALPQAGLESADIVYEELAEGGITRFLAIYHCSDADRVGPVRSARLVDPDILTEYAPALFGYSGGNALVLEKVQSTEGVVDLQHGKHGDAYERVQGRRAPHNLFTSTGKLRELSDAKGPPKTGFVFGEAPAPEASPASPPPGSSISLSFTAAPVVRYQYDQAAGGYLRFVADKSHNAENGSQLKTVNVVVLKVPVQPGVIRDAAGNLSPEISVIGEGEAVVLRGGIATQGRWVRKTLDDRTELQDSSGEPIPLSPGNTWIHLLPSDRPITVQ